MTMLQKVAPVLLFAGLISGAVDARGDLILDRTWSGADLFNDPAISFPTRLPILNGNGLDFNAGTSNLERLFEIPLVSAGALTTASPVVISVFINTTRRQSDFDPALLVNDGGVDFIGFQAADNLDGSGYIARFRDANGDGVADFAVDSPLFSNAGFPAVGGTLNATAVFTLHGAATNVLGSFLNGAGAANGAALDRTGSLSFSFWGNHPEELYRIDSLRIRVEGTAVPEPSSLLSAALGVAALAGYAGWRRVRFRMLRRVWRCRN